MKTALITGAAGGIGTSLCKAFRDVGYKVVAVDRKPIAESQDLALQLDVGSLCGDDAERSQSFQRLRDAVGESLDVLVNNAAVQHVARTADLSLQQWRETFDVNVNAAFQLVQGLLHPLERARGSVINIASIHATATKPGFVAYAASKAALLGMTRALAVDLGGRVRVNAISPAAVSTPMLREGFAGREDALEALRMLHPAGLIGDPQEVARVAVLLASNDIPFATGAVWNLDGGIGGRLHDPE